MLPAVQTILPQDPYHSVFKILVVQRRGVFLREVDLSGLINNRLNLFSSRFWTVPLVLPSFGQSIFNQCLLQSYVICQPSLFFFLDPTLSGLELR